MKKGEVVALAREKAYRYANQENAKAKPYAEAYLTAAVNYVLTKQYYLEYGQGEDKDMNGLFLAVYESVPILWNDKRKVHYFDMPAKVLALAKDRGIPYIGPQGNEEIQYPIIGQSTSSMAGKYMQYSTSSFVQIEGQKAILKNHNDIVKEVMVKMIQDASMLSEEDELPLPAGSEIEVINLVGDFLLGRRQLPQDNLNNERE